MLALLMSALVGGFTGCSCPRKTWQHSRPNDAGSDSHIKQIDVGTTDVFSMIDQTKVPIACVWVTKHPLLGIYDELWVIKDTVYFPLKRGGYRLEVHGVVYQPPMGEDPQEWLETRLKLLPGWNATDRTKTYLLQAIAWEQVAK
ncbi:MAG: hypothetical protein ACKVX7_04205 [Planctomycetota bacterium]